MVDAGFVELQTRLAQAKRVLVVSDGRPDGDSIGAATATLLWITRDYPHLHVEAFCKEVIPPSLQGLRTTQRFSTSAELFTQSWDLLLFHDASDVDHAGVKDLLPLLPAGHTIVNIDHHATNTRYGHINIVQTDACATTEVLYRCFQQAQIEISVSMCDSLLAGLFTDTSFFSNSGTLASSLAMAADLKERGAHFAEVYQATLAEQSLESLQLWGTALQRLHKHEDLDLALTHVFAHEYESLADTEAMSGLSNMLNSVCVGADTLMVVKDTSEGKIVGSVRSASRDISKLCRALGGGGHKKAAGFSLPGKLEALPDGSARIIPISTH